MEQAIVIICTVSCILTVSLVGSAQTGEEETFNRPSYLATAIRLSIPSGHRDPSEDEILRDVEDVVLDYPSSLESQRFIPVDADYQTIYSPDRQKRYMEFIGKRHALSRIFPKLHDEFRVNNRWQEYVDKPDDDEKDDIELSKRYLEFLGKRSIFSEPSKRYSEFLG